MAGGRTLTVYLAADTKRAQSALGGFGSKLKSFAKGLGIAAVAAAVYGLARAVGEAVDYLGDSIKAAEEAATANARLDQVLSQMGYAEHSQRVKEYAEAMALSVAVSDEEIKAVQARLATFGELAATMDEAGGAFDRATDAAYDLAAAGFGTAESNAIQLGKALQDPVKGLTSLGRAGVTFTDTEKARIKTLVESNRIGEAQRLVLNAIEKQVGGTAEATANASDKMSVAWGEIQEDIGEALLPAFEDVTAFVIDELVPAFQQWWQDVGPKVTEAIQDMWAWVTDELVPALQDLWRELDAKVLPAFQELGDAAGNLADSLDTLVRAFGGSQDAASDTADDIDWLKTTVNLVATRVQFLRHELDFWAGVVRQSAAVVRVLVDALKAAWGAFDDVAHAFDDFVNAIRSGVSDLWNAGYALIEGLANGLRAKWDEVIGWARSAASSLTSVFTGAWQIRSPSRVFITIGGQLVEGLKIGLDGLDAVSDDVRGKLDELVKASTDRVAAMGDKIAEALKAAREAMIDYRDSLVDATQSSLDLGQAWSDAVDAGDAGSFLDRFRGQLTDAKYFAQTLEELADSGASQALVEQIAKMGPGAGTALADELLTSGMIPQLNKLLRESQLVGQDEARYVAKAFYPPGVAAAGELIAGLADSIAKETKRLQKLGRQLGVELSVGVIAELEKALARFSVTSSANRSTSRSAGASAAPVILQVDGRTLGSVVVDSLQTYARENGAVRGVRLAS